MMETTLVDFKVGDHVMVDSVDGFGGPAKVVEIRDAPGTRFRVLMDDDNPPPFWAHDFEVSPLSASLAATLEHIRTVREILARAIDDLGYRSAVHDRSKLVSPEAEVFEEFTPKLAATTYGSDEYKSYLAAMKPALDHHYAANSHHPEHYRWRCGVCERRCTDAEWEVAKQGPNDSGLRYCPDCCRQGMIYEAYLKAETDKGLRGMSLLDLVEMLCDWVASSKRSPGGCAKRSIEIGQTRYGYSDELTAILLNTLPLIESDS